MKAFATYFIAVPLALVAAAVAYPLLAPVVALFFRPSKGPQGCEFVHTGYAVDATAGRFPVCVCSWCGRTGFQTTGELPKASRCSRPQFGLGNLTEAIIAGLTLGKAKKVEDCGCPQIQAGLNKRYFVARPWLRLFRKLPPPPWLNPNHSHRKFVRMEVQ
jgi:hypothetical protein